MSGKGRPWRAHATRRTLPYMDPVRVYLRAYQRWLDAVQAEQRAVIETFADAMQGQGYRLEGGSK